MLINKDEAKPGVIKDMTCNGECSRCGSCCGLFIPFTEKELKDIKEYVSKHNILPTNNRITSQNQLIARCCFYDEKEHKCNIYPVRPFVCRDFMCNHKDWKERRDMYEKRTKYNSSLREDRICATFDDAVYNDYNIILMYAFNSCLDPKGGVDSKKLIMFLRLMNRLDLLNHFSVYDENDNEIKGIDLLKEENQK